MSTISVQNYFDHNKVRVEAKQIIEPFETTLAQALDHVSHEKVDIIASSGLTSELDILLSSELLWLYMPAPQAYRKVLELIDAKPNEGVKVAAHAWDLRGTKEVEIKTVYTRRWTDDVEEDMDALREELDGVLDVMEGPLGEIQLLNRL
ncbi:hypothetical protein P171DRAFT_525450 [Karstenula rhodostoma CBS 690.94]|uniref:Uncharacterized protein n=1 Tax=Karstenula rhodostoma CBS 690.94 TaxID=1392251 RepID=A0A9P4U608_9PLEO|nr:hypothetical protein P171DRAFT_525450 [Karstenula rhodostoma CBS 690.94]